MDRLTRWETEALRRRSGRPRPGSRTIDLRDSPIHDRHGAVESGVPPAGTLLVPLDAWQRMLDQLGNLHEAGQQLAEVSARAAKAETEAEFLRERVSDLRGQLAAAGSVETPAAEPTPDTEATAEKDVESRMGAGEGIPKVDGIVLRDEEIGSVLVVVVFIAKRNHHVRRIHATA